MNLNINFTSLYQSDTDSALALFSCNLFIQWAASLKSPTKMHRRHLMHPQCSHSGVWKPCETINASSFLALTVFGADLA